jgi:hypothetical protein
MSIDELQEVVLDVTPATREAFAPYGHIVATNVSGQIEPGEAALDLMAGRPRLYIMRLEARVSRFDSIARHCRVTQCLASVGGRPWLLAVAPAADLDDLDAAPAADSIVAFERIQNDALNIIEADIQARTEYAFLGDHEIVTEWRSEHYYRVKAITTIDVDRGVDGVLDEILIQTTIDFRFGLLLGIDIDRYKRANDERIVIRLAFEPQGTDIAIDAEDIVVIAAEDGGGE